MAAAAGLCRTGDNTQATERCIPPAAGSIDIYYCMFYSFRYQANGGAIYVNRKNTVAVRNNAFQDCKVGTAGTTGPICAGGCVYLQDVNTTSKATDCCVTNCAAWRGSFIWFEPVDKGAHDTPLTGLAISGCVALEGFFFLQIWACWDRLVELYRSHDGRLASRYSAGQYCHGELQ